MARSELIRPLSELLRAHAGRRGEKVAYSDARRSVTYADLERRTARLAGHLVHRGLSRGGRVMILLNNSVEVVEGYLTAVRAGGVGVPVHPRASDEELAYLLRDSGAEAVLTDAAHLEQLRRVAAGTGLVLVAAGVAESTAEVASFEDLATTEPAAPARDDTGLDDLAWMLYTSGTTGQPKGVLSTQGSCLWSVAACYVPLLGLSPEDRVLWPLPMSHSLAHILGVHGVIAAGASARITDGFAGDDIVRLMQEEPYTFLVGVPTMYHDLLRHARTDGLEADSLRVCMVTGAVTSASLSESFEDTFGVRLIDSYGSTETCGAITMNRPAGALVAGSCGLPVPGLKVRIVDPATGEETEPGTEGEVWVRGPNVMLGYHDQPEATAAALRDGWYRTGDLARRDELGYLTITGRIKELIIRGGENIHPAEIEDVVRTVAGVADVAAAGRPDAELGEVPVVYVVPEAAGVVDAEAIVAACRGRLSYFKVPAAVYEVEAIPRTASGKVARRRLLETPARNHTAESTVVEGLFRLDWAPVAAPAARFPSPGEWALLGVDELGFAEADSAPASYADLTALRSAVDSGAPVPRTVLTAAPPSADEVRNLVNSWLAEERFAAARLVLVTRGAVGAGEEVTEPAGASAWGVVRAIAEPDRLGLVDLAGATLAELVAAVRSGRPQLVARGGVLRAPALAPVRVSSATDSAHGTAVVVGDEAGTIAAHLATLGFGAVLSVSPDEIADLAARVPAEHPLSVVVHAVDGDPDERMAAARRLHEVTRRTALTAFVLICSADSVLGNATAADPGVDAVSDAGLMALAEHRRAQGLPAVALGLDPRRSVEDSFASLDIALAADDAVLVAADDDALGAFRRFAAATAAEPTGTLRDRILGSSRQEQDRLLLSLVRTETAAVLGYADPARVPARRAFKELGFTSKSAVELRTRLAAATGLTLPATVAFDRPTPAELAEHLRAELLGLREVGERRSEGPAAVADDDPIAIVGMACRLPGGVTSPADLWDLVSEGVDALTGFPVDRGWDLGSLFDVDPDRVGTSYVREGGFLGDVAGFDAGFFGISPREALAMDPQQRLLLEVSWEALEHAGVDPHSLKGSDTGVFAGTNGRDYPTLLADEADELEGHIGIGNAGSVLSGRVSYFLGLEGPAVTVDTACSSSLVALHLAVRALRAGECSLALASGVSVMSTPEGFVSFSRQRGLAPDGRCKAFADAADGTGWGEGVGVLVVERLSDALRNGRRVLAVVRGSAVNQDGASSGLTAPNGPSQVRVIRAALASAELEPSDVDVVEAHGTGTRLGDPIEAGALLEVFGGGRGVPLLLGSVKSNIGHTQAAAGVAGVIKMVEALRRGVVPGSLHVDVPSSRVDWSSGAVELVTEARPWPQTGRPRRAGVSSFGVSGTNAHVIIEQAPRQETSAEQGEPGPVPLLLSARTEEALRAQAARMSSFMERDSTVSPAEVAHALATTRATFDRRAVLVGDTRESLCDALGALARGVPHPSVVQGNLTRGVDRPILVFPGQGSQWVGMALDLLGSSGVFAEAFFECAGVVEGLVDWSVVDQLGGGLDRVDVVQPVLFVVLVALARLWRSCGVVVGGVVGHSQGEIAAACVAGGLSLEDAARVVVLRSRLIGECLAGGGGMVSVGLPVGEVVSRLPVGVGVAAVNGPESVVVSGDVGGLEEFVAGCEGEGVRVRWVAVDYASHSVQVEGVRDELLRVLGSVCPRSSSVPFFSSVLGRWVDTAELGAEYWYRNLRETVGFQGAIEQLRGEGYRAFIEVSPHPVLTMSIEETVENGAVLGTLRRGDGGYDRFLRSLGEAHTHGIPIDWSTVIPSSDAPATPLPTYPFQRTRFWPQPATGRAGDPAALGLRGADHPLLGATVHPADGIRLLLTGTVSTATHPWLAGHSVLDTVIVPGSAFVELALRAGHELGCDRLDELTLETPLVLDGDGAYDLQVMVTDDFEVTVHSRPAGAVEEKWTRHAGGVLSTERVHPRAGWAEQWPPPGAEPLAAEDLYQRLADSGIAYGPAFQGLRAAWQREGEILAEVRLPEDEKADAARYGIHPALLDAALHGMGLGSVFTEPEDSGDGGSVAFSWSGVTLHASGATAVRVRLVPEGEAATSVEIADAAGAPVASVDSLVMRPVSADQLSGAGRVPRNSLFRVGWPEHPQPPGDHQRLALVGPDGWNWAPWLGTDEHSGAFRTPGELADAVAAGEVEPPETVVTTVSAGSGDDVSSGVRDVLAELVDTVQSWLRDDRFADTRLVVVTRRGVPAGATAEPDLPSASVWGLLRSAQSEHPDRIVLVDIADERADMGLLPAAVASGEPQIAIRAGRLHVPRLVRAEAAEAGGFDFRDHDTVLITGASGGLGRIVARHLAEVHGVRHLVLLSRRGGEAEGAAELAADLTGLGVEVTFAACDVADADALGDVLDGIPADRPLAGVVHTAGVVDDGLVESLSTDQLERVLRPKADGAWNLHRLTSDLDLRAFVLFSSGATTFGGPGQGAYAAANAFLDALAELRRAHGRTATSLAWGMWAESHGMGSRLDETALARMARNGALPLSVAEGLALFDGTQGLEHAALVPVRLDLAALRGRSDSVPPLFRELVPTPARQAAADDSATLLRKLAGLAEADRARELLETVRANAAAVLGHASAADIEPERSFLELGFDSLTAVELRNRMTRITGARLRATLVFDFPTPVRLTAHLLEQLDLDQDTGGDTRSASDTVLAELRRLSAALPAVVSDADSRRRVAGRLRELLLLCAEPTPSGGDLDSATDDELFALVDTEFERGVEIA